MGCVELNDPPILDDQGDRAVPHAVEEARQFGHQRLQIIASCRVETGQRAPPGRPRRRNIDEID
jgi:hypothetical protein